MIQQNYIITSETCAILPAREIDYQTIVIKEDTTLYVTQTPLEIMKASCLHYWATYEGRRRAVIEKLRYKQKTPIPVSVTNKLCLFPTHAPTHINNCWINRAQVNYWERTEIAKRTKNRQTEIIFYNWHRIELGISMHTLQEQMERGFRVMVESGMLDLK